jgi:hypothetical protein
MNVTPPWTLVSTSAPTLWGPTCVAATLAIGWTQMAGLVVVSEQSYWTAKCGSHASNKFVFAADIHECNESLHLCEQVCTNTESSYECSCNPGYTLSINRFSCNSEIMCSYTYDWYTRQPDLYLYTIHFKTPLATSEESVLCAFF